jgi:tetratricopeptide (TPR) repeat protein
MKRVSYILLTVLFSLALLVVLEFILRIFIPGHPPPMIRKLGEIDGKSFMLFDRVGPASFFGPQANRMSPAEIVGFYMPKPTNTLRIITVGESAMKGFPQPDAFNAASILREMLRDEFPGKTIEVLNFGATAVASFPVLKIAEAAVQCDPDILIAMVGHNEYFGAYGVVATRHLGSQAWLFNLDYRVRHTAIAQAIEKIISSSSKPQHKQLMEMMAGMDFIAPDSPLREKAFNNLDRHIEGIRKVCASENIPLILCVPPGNESDFAPVGKDKDTQGARYFFQRGKKEQSEGSFDEATADFRSARDLDTMPWRASSRMQNLIRSLETNQSIRICDVDQAFREYGSTNGIGWNLMDDHVHPNINGQLIMAGAMLDSVLTIVRPETPMKKETTTSGDYLRRLGDNVYDRYGVVYTMSLLFNVPFLAESNPEAKEMFEKKSLSLFQNIPREIRETVGRWQSTADLVIGKRPLSGQAGMELLRLNKYDEAIPLLSTAIRSVPPYSSWAMEYTYYLLASIKHLNGFLGEPERILAEKTLHRGDVILSLGQASSGQTERFAGRMLQLLDRDNDAIAYLEKARVKSTGMDKVATDRALIEAYTKTGRVTDADRIKREGLAGDPALSQYYR